MKEKARKNTVIAVSNADRKRRNYGYLIILLICVLFYANTLSLNYAFDDMVAITGNQFTRAGFKGIPDILSTDLFAGFYGKDNNMVTGGRYRPLSVVTFAVEYQFFGSNPLIGHLINLVLLILTGMLMFDLLQRLLVYKGYKPDQKYWYISVPLIAAVLFVGHPVHTEVIANVKGRDEILSLLLSLATLNYILSYLSKPTSKVMALSALCFFGALLSKENAITFLAVIPLTIWFFTGYSMKNTSIALIPLAVSTIVFLLIRQWVIGHNASGGLENDLMNNPFINMTQLQKYATIFYTLGVYLRLLIFPHPLTFDYYPYHIPVVSMGELKAIIPLIIYLSLAIYAIVTFRKKGVATYSVLYYFITLSIVSNLLFPIGAFMNERFLYMPSLGFCLVIAWILVHGVERAVKNRIFSARLITGMMLVVLSLFAVKTISRNLDWKDSYTLFTTDVKVSSNSAKGNALAGEYLIQRAATEKVAAVRDSLLRQSIKYQQKAIQIYPKQIIALFNLAAAYYQYNKNYDTILTIYSTILHYLPDNPKVYQNFQLLMNQYGNPDHKIELFRRLRIVNPERYDVNINLGTLYLSDKKDPVSAVPFLETAVRLNPSDFTARNSLGIAYGTTKNWAGAEQAFEAAERLNPNDIQLLKNMAAVYQNLGKAGLTKKYLERAANLEKKNVR
ncbi:MAG: tetratricopeptide repeat protein [Bacteroidales bacterium]